MSLPQRTAKVIRFLVLAAMVLAMTGCAATYTGIRYKDLQVQNKMSASIFLDPVPPQERTVFVQVRNTSDKPFFIQDEVKQYVTSNGYTVVEDPTKAHYILQANVLSVGVVDESALERAGLTGFGGPILGGVAGGLLGGSHATEGALIGVAVGAAAEVVSGAMVKVVNYMVVTDLQISERTAGAVSEEFQSELQQGTGNTSISQRAASTTNVKRYQTRIVSTARQTNLTWDEAYPQLRQGIAQAIAGVM